MFTVRKQVYIAEYQERRLKERSRELGVSDAELIRRGLDFVLLEAAKPPGMTARRKALDDLLAHAEEIAQTLRPRLRPYRREELHEKPESRWPNEIG